MSRPRSATILAYVFGVSSLANLVQIVLGVTSPGEPLVLVIEHTLAFLAAAGAAVTIWRGSRAAPWFVLAWGAVIAWLLGSLPAVIDLPRESSVGIWVSGGGVFVIAIVIAIFLRRRQQAA